MKLLSIFLYSMVLLPNLALAVTTSDPEVPNILKTQFIPTGLGSLNIGSYQTESQPAAHTERKSRKTQKSDTKKAVRFHPDAKDHDGPRDTTQAYVPLSKPQPGSQPEPSTYSPYKAYAPYAVGFCAALGAYVTFAKSAGKAAEAAAQQQHHWSRAYLTPKNYGRTIRFLYSGLTGTGTALATWFILRYV